MGADEDVRDGLIEGIVASQRRMQHLLTVGRSNPIYQSTLTMQQLKVLLLLAHTGGSSGQELAAVMGVSPATMTGIVDRLVAAGLTLRREDPADRRVRRLTLTAAGQEAIDGIIAAGRDHLVALLGRLDADALRVVADAMALLTAAAEADATELPRRSD
ncbi:MAG TPA: MarR family transcriptional regulator [Pseudonocardiaceae bacterium]